MSEMTLEEMRAAVAKADLEEAAKRNAELEQQFALIRAFNADPIVAEFKEKLAELAEIPGVAVHKQAIDIGLSGIGTLA